MPYVITKLTGNARFSPALCPLLVWPFHWAGRNDCTMEPLSALSVASSAIQIVDYSSKLWRQIKELYESEGGALENHKTLRTNAEQLCSLNSGLRKLLAPASLQRDLTSEEETIVSVCSDCDSAAGQLLGALQRLSLDDGSEVCTRLIFVALR